MYHSFYGAESLEDFEARLKVESIIIDSEMIEKGDNALFSSVYDRLYLKNRKKIVEEKSDAEIVDNIFKEKLNKNKPQVIKPKGLASFQKKPDAIEKPIAIASKALENSFDTSDKQFVVSIFK